MSKQSRLPTAMKKPQRVNLAVPTEAEPVPFSAVQTVPGSSNAKGKQTKGTNVPKTSKNCGSEATVQRSAITSNAKGKLTKGARVFQASNMLRSEAAVQRVEGTFKAKGKQNDGDRVLEASNKRRSEAAVQRVAGTSKAKGKQNEGVNVLEASNTCRSEAAGQRVVGTSKAKGKQNEGERVLEASNKHRSEAAVQRVAGTSKAKCKQNQWARVLVASKEHRSEAAVQKGAYTSAGTGQETKLASRFRQPQMRSKAVEKTGQHTSAATGQCAQQARADASRTVTATQSPSYPSSHPTSSPNSSLHGLATSDGPGTLESSLATTSLIPVAATADAILGSATVKSPVHAVTHHGLGFCAGADTNKLVPSTERKEWAQSQQTQCSLLPQKPFHLSSLHVVATERAEDTSEQNLLVCKEEAAAREAAWQAWQASLAANEKYPMKVGEHLSDVEVSAEAVTAAERRTLVIRDRQGREHEVEWANCNLTIQVVEEKLMKEHDMWLMAEEHRLLRELVQRASSNEQRQAAINIITGWRQSKLNEYRPHVAAQARLHVAAMSLWGAVAADETDTLQSFLSVASLISASSSPMTALPLGPESADRLPQCSWTPDGRRLSNGPYITKIKRKEQARSQQRSHTPSRRKPQPELPAERAARRGTRDLLVSDVMEGEALVPASPLQAVSENQNLGTAVVSPYETSTVEAPLDVTNRRGPTTPASPLRAMTSYGTATVESSLGISGSTPTKATSTVVSPVRAQSHDEPGMVKSPPHAVAPKGSRVSDGPDATKFKSSAERKERAQSPQRPRSPSPQRCPLSSPRVLESKGAEGTGERGPLLGDNTQEEAFARVARRHTWLGSMSADDEDLDEQLIIAEAEIKVGLVAAADAEEARERRAQLFSDIQRKVHEEELADYNLNPQVFEEMLMEDPDVWFDADEAQQLAAERQGITATGEWYGRQTTFKPDWSLMSVFDRPPSVYDSAPQCDLLDDSPSWELPDVVLDKLYPNRHPPPH